MKLAVKLLRDVIPLEVCFSCYLEICGDQAELKIYNPGNYSKATELMRNFGVRVRSKEVNAEFGFTTLSGDICEGIRLVTLPDGLPPTCRKETYIEKIPKKATVETGEFIEVERTRIVCGEDHPDPSAVVIEDGSVKAP